MPWKNKYVHIKSFSIHIMYFESHYGRFYRFFEEFYIFTAMMDPFQTSLFSALYFKHSLLKWRLQFMEMTECLKHCMFYRTIIANYFSEKKIKINWKIIDIRRLFCSWLTLRKRHILRLRRLVIPLITKTLIIYSKVINI